MSNPVLELQLRAEGVDQVKNLTAALAALNGQVGNLGQAKTALAQLKEIGGALNSMRTELKQSIGEIKDVLTKGFAGALQDANKTAVKGMSDVSKTFDQSMKKLTETISKRNEEIARKTTELNAGVTRQMAEGGAKAGQAYADGVQKSVSKVRISFPAVALPNGAKASYSVMGMDNLAAGRAALDELRKNVSAQQVIREQEATMMNQAVLQFRAIMAERLADQIAFEEKQKARFLTYQAALSERLDAEQFMMQGAVLKFRAIQDERIAAQIGFEAKQKEAWMVHAAAQQERMKAEEFMMADAVVKYRQIQDAQIVAQLASEAKQKELWFAHTAALSERLEAEKFMMDGAVIKYRQLEDAKIAAQIASEAKQKEAWAAHVAAQRARMVEEASMMDQALVQFRKHQADMTAASIRGSVGQAMSTPGTIAGPYSSISGANYGGLVAVATSAEDSTSKVRRLGEALGIFSKQAGDAHSAARGLASGFNLMWLTWGNVVPLLAGAAISHATAEMVSMGAEVQHTFQIIKVLSDETTTSVDGLNQQMLSLARSGPFGPLAIAEAMKTLSLAGLNAKEVSSSIKDVLNFAVAGTTSIEKAADVMTSVGTAFKIGADSYNYIGDVIAKTAAVSKSSVEGIGEAFKSASVINSQYGASLEDVGVGLALLANAGIQNTAAGTSLRNFYVDILGRTPKVKKALEELGLGAEFAFDKATGKARPLVEIITKLNDALNTKTPIAQTQFLKDITSERGGKEAVQLLEAVRSKAKEAKVDVKTALDEIMYEVQNAAGFVAVSAATLALTPLNQMKSVTSALQASLVESFGAIQPYVLQVSANLKEAFGSDSFKNAIQHLGTLIGGLTLFLTDHLQAIVTLGTAYLGMKIVGIISDMYAGFVGRVILTTEAVVGETAATNLATAAKVRYAAATAATAEAQALAATSGAAASAATSGLASALGTGLMWIGRLVPWITALTVAWQLYSFWADKSSAASSAKANNSDALITALKAEAERLKEINDAKALGISLDELRAKKNSEQLRRDINAPVDAAQSNLDKLLAQQAGPAVVGPSQGGLANAARRKQAQDIADAQKALDDQVRIRNGKMRESVEAEWSVIREANRMKDSVKADALARIQPGGTGGHPENGRATGKGLGALGGTDNDETMIMQGYRVREAAEKQVTSQQRALIESRHRNLLDDEGVYQAKLQTLLAESDQRRLDDAQTSGVALLDEYRQNIDKIRSNTKATEAEKEQALSNLKNIYVRDSEVLNQHLEELNATSARRIEEASNNSQGVQLKAAKANSEFWEKELANANGAKNKFSERVNDAFLSDVDRARLEAVSQTTAKYADDIGKLADAYDRAKKALKDFTDAAEKDGPPTPQAMDTMQGLSNAAQIADWNQQRGVYMAGQIAKVNGAAAAQQERAKEIEAARKEADKMAKEVSSHLADAILDGGKDGFKSLKDWAKQYFLREPLKVFLQGILMPIGNAVANIVYGGLAGQGGAAGGMSALGSAGNLGSLANVAAGAKSTYTVGAQYLGASQYSMSGANAAGTLYANATGTGMDGLMASTGGYGTMAGTAGQTTTLGMSSGALGATGIGLAIVAGMKTSANLYDAGYRWDQKNGWYDSSATVTTAAANSLGIKGKTAAILTGNTIPAAIMAKLGIGGETRSGAEYIGTNKISGPSGGEIAGDAIRGSIQNTIDGTNDLIKQLGGTTQITEMRSGLESSRNNKGFAYAGAQLSNGRFVGEGLDRAAAREQRGMSNMNEKEAAKEFSEQLQQVMLESLQKSDIKGKVAEYFQSLGDINALHGDALTAASTRLNTIMSQRAELEKRLAETTPGVVTAESKLADARAAERTLYDEYAQDLLDRIYAQEDLNTAQQALAASGQNLLAAYNAELDAKSASLDAMKQSIADLQDYAKSLRSWVNDAFTGTDSPLSGIQLLTESAKQFNDTLALAHGGDKDARSALTGKASTYITSLKDQAATSVDYAMGFAAVTGALTTEAASAESQASIQQQALDAAQALLDTAKNQLTELGLLNGNVQTFAQAWADYQAAKQGVTTAQTKVDTLKAAQDAQSATAVAQASAANDANAATKASDLSTKQTAIQDWFNGSSGNDPTGFASGGYHEGGWRMVGENGPELAYTGPEQIYNTRQTQSLLESAFSGGGGNDDALIQEVRMLRTAVEANTNFTYRLQKDFSELKDRGFPVVNTADGATPLKTTAA